jgi:hypothetical protein
MQLLHIQFIFVILELLTDLLEKRAFEDFSMMRRDIISWLGIKETTSLSRIFKPEKKNKKPLSYLPKQLK